MIDIKRCESSYSECAGVVEEHANSVLNTLDSWRQEALIGSDIDKFSFDSLTTGCCCIIERH